MSNKTVDMLFAAVKNDSTYISAGVLNDYFGIINMSNEENLHTIFGIYSGLIKTKSVSKQLFENCFFTNRLDELIHKKSKYHGSGYYNRFITKNIKIGNTYIGECGVEELPIMDDDHCPSCQTTGYITEHQYLSIMSPDCVKCGVFMCKMCVRAIDDVGTCPKCL
jgi:hypothetical protein